VRRARDQTCHVCVISVMKALRLNALRYVPPRTTICIRVHYSAAVRHSNQTTNIAVPPKKTFSGIFFAECQLKYLLEIIANETQNNRNTK